MQVLYKYAIINYINNLLPILLNNLNLVSLIYANIIKICNNRIK
jgi:hypothetical protein